MTESPKYQVFKKYGEIEIRQYAGYIKAEVDLDGRDYKSAVESGFRVLAGYIFGENTAREKIEMTTPVQTARSQKIAMTTPVIVSGEDQYSVAFIMPSEYTLESLPIPMDNRIRFTVVPKQRMAAIRFSGYFNQSRIQDKKECLRRWLEQQGLEPEGDFIVAGYNPPWVPGILARNEVIVCLKGTAGHQVQDES